MRTEAVEKPPPAGGRQGLNVLRPGVVRRYTRRYTDFVKGMRILLPLTAVLLLAAVVIWPHLRTGDLRFRIGFAAATGNLDDDPNLLNPRYVGTDEKNRPYAVTADIAKRLSGPDVPQGKVRIGLESPKADITLEDGTWLVLTADTGVFGREKETLDLEGKVNLFHDTGYEFRTEQASVDLAAGIAAGDAPVEGQGPFGMIDGEGFRLLERGNRVVFTGKAKLTLFPEEARQ